MSVYNNISVTNDQDNKVNSLVQRTIISIDANGFDNITTIGIYAFYHCTALTNVKMSNTIIEINSRAFEGCTALSNIKMSNGLRYIYGGAFWGCTSLTSITLPSLSGIYQNAFNGCNNLTSVTILRNDGWIPVLYDSNVFANTPIASGTGYIYVPAALVDSYKAAGGWKTYASQIRAIPE